MIRWKSRQVFPLLASLVTTKQPLSRERLASRLWSDSPNPLQNLRPILTFVRQVMGAEALVTEGDYLRLAPNVLTTDLAEITTAYQQAKALPDPVERVARLQDAVDLLQGDFLEGFEESPDATDRWLTEQRNHVNVLSVEIWNLLAQALAQTGNSRGAAEARREAKGLSESTIRLASPRKVLEWSDLREHVATLHREGLSLTTHEKQIVVGTFLRVLSIHSESLFQRLCYLGVFPQTFTADQAERVAELSHSDLHFLYQQGLLIAEATRYTLCAEIEKTLWRQVKNREQEKRREYHATFFAERAAYFCQAESGGGLAAWAIAEQPNILQAVRWWTARPVTPTTLSTMKRWHNVALVLPTLQSVIFPLLATWYEKTIQQGKAEPFVDIINELAIIKLHLSDFEGAVYWVKQALDHVSKVNDPGAINQMVGSLLAATHHLGDEGAFDAATDIAFGMLNSLPNSEHIYTGAWLEFHLLIAENRLTRRDLEGALAANTRVAEFTRQHFSKGNDLHSATARWASNRYQRGQILYAMGKIAEALVEWDNALRDFRETGLQQGVADCLHQTGIAFKQQGLLNLGREHIERAIKIYTELGKHPSRAAALGSLGDIAVQQKDWDNARQLYEEGLAYWEIHQHPRWLSSFTLRLQCLESICQRNSC